MNTDVWGEEDDTNLELMGAFYNLPQPEVMSQRDAARMQSWRFALPLTIDSVFGEKPSEEAVVVVEEEAEEPDEDAAEDAEARLHFRKFLTEPMTIDEFEDYAAPASRDITDRLPTNRGDAPTASPFDPSGYISMVYEHEVAVKQESVGYFFYPFDSQKIEIDVYIPRFNNTACGTRQIFNREKFDEIVAAHSGWQLSAGDEARGRHNTLDNLPYESKVLDRAGEVCQVSIYISRRYTRYLLRRILPNILVVLGGLLALWLDPTKPPLVGGRCALLVTATLLISNTLSKTSSVDKALQDVGWADIFSLCQIFMLVMGLLQTVLVHSLTRSELPRRVEQAIAFDQVMRVSMPISYLLLVVFLLYWGITNYHDPAALFTMGSFFILIALVPTYLIYTARARQMGAARREALGRFASDPTSKAHLKECFDFFDMDRSGELSGLEVRDMLIGFFPKLGRKGRNELLVQTGWTKRPRNQGVSLADLEAQLEVWSRMATEAEDSPLNLSKRAPRPWRGKGRELDRPGGGDGGGGGGGGPARGSRASLGVNSQSSHVIELAEVRSSAPHHVRWPHLHLSPAADSAPSVSKAMLAPRRRATAPAPDAAGSSSSKRRRDHDAGIFSRLADREIDNCMRRTFPKRSARERFSNFRLRATLDMYAPEGAPLGLDHLMAHRCRILELCTADGMIFGLTENGICAAFDLHTGRRICILNADNREVVRSLFHNKANGTLITVSVYAEDQYACLRCRATKLDALREGVTSNAESLFASESLRWPGFVEFDDVNGKVLTFSADLSTYKVWSMAEPSKILYAFSEKDSSEGIIEIKVSPGIMLLVCKHEETYVSLRILSIETGETLRDFRQPIKKGKKTEIIEQFNEKLLLKQEGSPLQIIDLLTNAVVKIRDTTFKTPSAFIFLYENQTFLAFKDNLVTVWNFKGERVTTFEDHMLWFPIPDIDHTSVIYITRSQETIISLCQDADPCAEAGASRTTSQAPHRVSIHVSSIANGRCLAKIDWKQVGAGNSDITALCYSETCGDIVTGNEHGKLQVWSN